MQKMNLTINAAPLLLLTNAGQASRPENARPSVAERKTSDPSSTNPMSGGYPVPSFFQHRIKARDYDPL